MTYELVSSDASPLALADAKAYMKVGTSAEDSLIQSLINAATEWGESYTRRSFRAQTWKLLLDAFDDPVDLRRQKVDAITSIKHYVDGSLVEVNSDVYLLAQSPQGAQIHVVDGEEWPDDTDTRPQAVEVNFTTAPWSRHKDTILEALRRHVLALYANRGDCPECTTADFAARSGAAALYDMLRVARV